MSDVAFLSFRRMLGYGTTEMRCRQPAGYLEAAGWSASAAAIDRPFPMAERALVLHRVRDTPLARSVVRLARAKGLRIAYDIDDLVADEDPSRFSRSIAAMMGEADLVTVSTAFLKARVDAIHPACTVVRNGLSPSFLKIAEASGGGAALRTDGGAGGEVRIGYFSGSAHHDTDLAMIAPDLARLLRERPDTRLVVGGKIAMPPEFAALGERVTFEPFRPYDEFISLLGEIDINIVPLDLSADFARARSELKFIEASGFGVVTVASPSPAYAEAIADGETGVLCQTDAWFETLRDLVDAPERRRALGEAARTAVLRDYGPARMSAQWDTLMRTLLAAPAPAPPPSRIAATTRLALTLGRTRARSAARTLMRGR